MKPALFIESFCWVCGVMHAWLCLWYECMHDTRMQYLVMAPVAVHGARRVVARGWGDIDLAFALILPSLLLRMVHNQIWISAARYQTARGKHRIVDRGIEFDQVDRERGW
jgi:hypothetical protein